MSQAATQPVYVYAIDASDRIVSLSDPWLAFAVENDAPELSRERVLGASLWDFIEGHATRNLYRALFERIREHEMEASIPFRCDAPDRFRFMRLRMRSAPEGGIDFTGVLLREQCRPYASLLDQALPRSDYSFPICSLCKRVFGFGEWLEPERALAQFGRFDSTQPPRLEQSLCDGCRRLGPDPIRTPSQPAC